MIKEKDRILKAPLGEDEKEKKRRMREEEKRKKKEDAEEEEGIICEDKVVPNFHSYFEYWLAGNPPYATTLNIYVPVGSYRSNARCVGVCFTFTVVHFMICTST